MPRAPSEKMAEAKKLFDKGMPMVDIAKKLDVSAGTVRSWKNRHGWGKESKKNKRNVANDGSEENATLQKRKRGGQPGNQNSKGVSKGKGNPHPLPPPDRTKHGAYRAVFFDALDQEEQDLLSQVPDAEEDLLIEQIQLFSIRERRILKAINRIRSAKGDVAMSSMIRFEEKRSFDKDTDDEKLYEAIQRKKVESKKILPGQPYNLQTVTTNKELVIARLEQELSSVQGKKTKAIEALAKIRLEKAKLESEQIGSEVVNDWINAVVGESEEDYESG